MLKKKNKKKFSKDPPEFILMFLLQHFVLGLLAIKTCVEADIQIHVFLTSELAGDEWAASRPGRIIPGKASGIHWIGGRVGLLPLSNSEPWGIQLPVATALSSWRAYWRIWGRRFETQSLSAVRCPQALRP
jgi:hypothetical protein